MCGLCGRPGNDYPVDPNLCARLTTNSFLRCSSLSRRLRHRSRDVGHIGQCRTEARRWENVPGDGRQRVTLASVLVSRSLHAEWTGLDMSIPELSMGWVKGCVGLGRNFPPFGVLGQVVGFLWHPGCKN